MPNTGTPQGQEPATDPQSTDSATPPATDPAPTGEPKDPWEGIPDEWAWTKQKVEEANREAASRRVALREAEDKLKAAKTPEEFEAAISEYKSKESKLATDLSKERAARKHKLSDELLEFLTGTTDELIEAQAAKLAALKPAESAPPKVITKTPPAGGVTPTTVGEKTVSGRDLWKAHKGRR